MRARLIIVVGLTLAVAAGVGLVHEAQSQETGGGRRGAGAASPSATAERPRTTGYLAREAVPEAAAFIPPAPLKGDQRDRMDRAIFKSTRKLQGSARWKMAAADNNLRAGYLLEQFSCSVGANLTPEEAPALARLITRMSSDSGAASSTAKDVFKRQRPYVMYGGNICIEKTAGLANSPDYPSGHAILGWTAGLIVSQVVPDRAAPIMSRARAYGESRMVCGMHSLSAVEASRTASGAVFAALQSAPQFQADIVAARTEVAAIRANSARKPDPAACKIQADLVNASPLAGLK